MPKAELEVDGSIYRVISSEFELKRLHSLIGRPTSSHKAGHTTVTIILDEKSYLWTENINDYALIKSMKLLFYKKDEKAVLLEMELLDSYICKYKESSSYIGKQPATITMVFSSRCIMFGSQEVYRQDHKKTIR